MKLNQLLSLQPLDRVEVNNDEERSLVKYHNKFSAAFHHDLSFYYVQRLLRDGRIEVRQPGGYVNTIDPHEISDIKPGNALIVRAMPRKVYLERLAKYKPPFNPNDYFEAFVLYVEKDRWNRVDRVFVHFLDDTLNDPTYTQPWPAPIHPEDIALVAQAARRTRMPVMTAKGSVRGHCSADTGCKKEESQRYFITTKFIYASLTGQIQVRDILSDAGISQLTAAKLNRLIQRSK